MNYETASQLTFTRTFVAAPAQPSHRLGGRLVDVLGMAQLLAAAEGEAIEALQSALAPAVELACGTDVVLRQSPPAFEGRSLRLDGWVQRMNDGAEPSVEFVVVVRDGPRTVAEVELRFAVIARGRASTPAARPGQAAATPARLAQPV